MDSAQRTDGRSWSSAVLGGAVVLALLECGFTMTFSAPSFDGAGERLTFFGIELSLALGTGAVLALLGLGVLTLLRGIAPSRRMHVLAALALPVIGYASWSLARGPKVRALPGHDVLVVVGALLATGALDLLLRTAERLAPRILASRARLVVAMLCVLVAFFVHCSDEWVLPRLYPTFHRGLELVALTLCASAVALAWRRGVPALLVLLLLAFLPLSYLQLRRARAVTSVLLDRAPTGGTLARLLLRAAPSDRPIVAVEVAAEAPLPPGPTLEVRDIILVTIDALRADRLVPRVMPTASALAAHGVRFDEAYTQVPHTSFAVATLLTGKFVYSLSALGLDAASHETLAQVMRRERYKTAAFFPPAVFFIDHDRLLPLEKSAYGFEYVKYEYLDATRRTDQVISFYEKEKPARSFVWVHYLEPHEPYDVHEGVTEGTPGAPASTPGLSDAQRRYEGEIRYVDKELERLVGYLQKKRPGALLILCADHGEEFGEHGGRYHGTTLFDEQVRVPLFFSILGGEATLPARELAGAVGLVDVAPTLLSLLGVTRSAKMRGRDLSGFMNKVAVGPHPRPVFAEIDRKKMIVDGTFKLACDLDLGTCALYDRASDPAEQRDVSARHPDVTARLRSQLDAFMNEQSRFEAHHQLPPAQQQLFERAQRGDASAAPELVAILPELAGGPRHDALRLLSTLPPVPAASPSLGELPAADALLVLLVRARGGDEAARVALLARLDGPPGNPPMDDELYARIALATHDVGKMALAIQRTEERGLVVALASALGKTHDASALDALLIALAPVRSRAQVVDAIGELGAQQAVGPLVRWLPNDPYVMVRSKMVHALALLSAQHPDAHAQVEGALIALAQTEDEASVLRVIAEALGPGRHGAIEVGSSIHAVRGRQRLLFAPAKGVEGLTFVDGMVVLPPRWDERVPGALELSRPQPGNAHD
ncbi:MAG: sulfatase-like hydrolase/transferase [Polyangia bacterium]